MHRPHAQAASPDAGGNFYPLSNRLYRLMWSLAWTVLARWTPAPLHSYRRFLLRRFGADVSKGAHVYGSAKIWSPKNLTIGRGSAIGPYAIIYNMAQITIGDEVVISQYAHLCSGTHDISSTDFALVTRPIAIADRAWIAAGAFVGPGVSVAKGAVVGAGAVVRSNIPEWAVVIGNPAQVVKRRNIARGA